MNKSAYNATPRYVTVGTMEVEEEKPEDDVTKGEPDGEDAPPKSGDASANHGDGVIDNADIEVVPEQDLPVGNIQFDDDITDNETDDITDAD